MDNLQELAQEAREAESWLTGLTATRDSAIRQAHREGMSCLLIASMTGLPLDEIVRICA